MMDIMIKIILMMNIITGNKYDNIFHVVYVYVYTIHPFFPDHVQMITIIMKILIYYQMNHMDHMDQIPIIIMEWIFVMILWWIYQWQMHKSFSDTMKWMWKPLIPNGLLLMMSWNESEYKYYWLHGYGG